jgi:hypothetical protein
VLPQYPWQTPWHVEDRTLKALSPGIFDERLCRRLLFSARRQTPDQLPQVLGARFGTVPFLPMSRAEMDKLGWDSCDIMLVTGDAYVDHPSFGMAVIGRMLEAQGFRVGIIAQPDWHQCRPFKVLGKAQPVLGRDGGQHGFHDQPLHGRPQDPQ